MAIPYQLARYFAAKIRHTSPTMNLDKLVSTLIYFSSLKVFSNFKKAFYLVNPRLHAKRIEPVMIMLVLKITPAQAGAPFRIRHLKRTLSTQALFPRQKTPNFFKIGLTIFSKFALYSTIYASSGTFRRQDDLTIYRGANGS